MTDHSPTSQVFLLPDLGEGLTEAEIRQWMIAVGDVVTIDQIVVEVETTKVTVEVPCPFAGHVEALHGEAGETIPVGAPLMTVAVTGESSETTPTPPEIHAHSAITPDAVIVGYGSGPVHSSRESRRRRRRDPEAKASVRNVSTTGSPSAKPRVISPSVRRGAREHGLEASLLNGTGPHGLVLRRDLDGAIARTMSETHQTSTMSRVTVGARDSDQTRIPLRGIRRTIADNLSRSTREIPAVTTWVDIDATSLVEARQAAQAADPSHRVSLVAMVAHRAIETLASFPELNASVDMARGEIILHHRVHLGFAVQTDRGLIVPVIRDAQSMSLIELADTFSQLTEGARAGRLGIDQLNGGTFTLNNYGVFGVDGGTPIINYTETGMLGIGRIIDKPWVVAGQLAIRKIAQLSLTFDHRVCDGHTAGGFLRAVADALEQSR